MYVMRLVKSVAGFQLTKISPTSNEFNNINILDFIHNCLFDQHYSNI